MDHLGAHSLWWNILYFLSIDCRGLLPLSSFEVEVKHFVGDFELTWCQVLWESTKDGQLIGIWRALDTIWGFAHPNNKEVTGPKENFEKMLLSEPYNAILDLKEYSFTKTVETEDSNHYEIKILAKNNSYFEVIWVFQFDECPDNPKDNCWLTIAVTCQTAFFA